MPKELSTRTYPGNKEKYSNLSADLRWLITQIVEETKEDGYYLNHGENRDPTNAWGNVPTGVNVMNYYQPASASEYKNRQTIWSNTDYSGRHRLLSRVEDKKIAFFRCSHPSVPRGAIKNMGYGAPTWVDMSDYVAYK